MLELLPEVPPGVLGALQTAAMICGGLGALLLFSMTVWTARDAAARTSERWLQALAVILVLTLNVFGLLVYLLLRPRETRAERLEREMVEEVLARELSLRSIGSKSRPRASDRPAAADRSPGYRPDEV